MEPGPGQGSHQTPPPAMAHGPSPESASAVCADADIAADTADVVERQAEPLGTDTEASALAAPEVCGQRAEATSTEAAAPTALPDEASQVPATGEEAVPPAEAEQADEAELGNEAKDSTALPHEASQAPAAGDEAVPAAEVERADEAELGNEAKDSGEMEKPVPIDANKMTVAAHNEAAPEHSLVGGDAPAESLLPDGVAPGHSSGHTGSKGMSHSEAAELTNEVQSSVESHDGTEDTPPPKGEHEDDSDGSAASVTSPLDFPDELATNPHEFSAGVMNLAKCIEGEDSAKPAQSSQCIQSRPADPMKMPSGYPASAASYFGEYGAHRLRWAHAVNGRRRLRAALCTAANFLEADVTSGPLVHKDEVPVQGGQDGNGLDTRVKTPAGQPVIMAHYPTELSSDLSFESFMQTVLRHNDRVRADAATEITAAAAAAGQGCGQGQSSGSSPAAASTQPKRNTSTSTEEEATIFTRQLDIELEQASAQGGALASCVGSRRDTHQGRHSGPLLTLKGVKLDFKRFDCVAPCIEHLRSLDAARKLGGHLWLNADVFAGPGALLTPFDAKQFVRLCAENLPEAVLSLSWGSSMLSTMKSYSSEMVDHMIELCMTPIVPRQLPSSRVTNGAHGLSETGDSTTAGSDRDRESGAVCREVKAPSDGEMYYTPAAICRHITFAVAVEYAQLSAGLLSKLLDSVPGTSLTLFSGYGSIGVSPVQVKELIQSYGHTRLFLDLKLSKAWRSCGVKGACSLQ